MYSQLTSSSESASARCSSIRASAQMPKFKTAQHPLSLRSRNGQYWLRRTLVRAAQAFQLITNTLTIAAAPGIQFRQYLSVASGGCQPGIVIIGEYRLTSD